MKKREARGMSLATAQADQGERTREGTGTYTGRLLEHIPVPGLRTDAHRSTGAQYKLSEHAIFQRGSDCEKTQPTPPFPPEMPAD